MSAQTKIDLESTKVETTPNPQLRVLIVDDSRLQRKILSSTIKKWGFDVVEAADGAAGLAIAQDQLPDIVISDWMMPGMTGLEFCKEFRAIQGDSYRYFILVTSKSEKDEIAAGLDAGADDFLTKPVNAHELRARVRAGERILQMQDELTEKNRVISDTLNELQRLYDSLDDDLREAKKLQQSLIPERSKSFETGDVTLYLRQSGHVGGDLVGMFPAGEGKLGLFSIDVSGHGISSALMTARLAGYLSATSPEQNISLVQTEDGKYEPRSPLSVVEDLNNLILDEMETEHYFTLILAIVDLKTGSVRMAQAGHPHPAIQRNSGSVTVDGPGGFPVGLVPGAQFSEFEINLTPGDRLLLQSDGIVECPDASENLLGEEGLAEIMKDLKDVSGPAFFESLVWRLSEFAGDQSFPDDISGILFEFTGQPDA